MYEFLHKLQLSGYHYNKWCSTERIFTCNILCYLLFSLMPYFCLVHSGYLRKISGKKAICFIYASIHCLWIWDQSSQKHYSIFWPSGAIFKECFSLRINLLLLTVVWDQLCVAISTQSSSFYVCFPWSYVTMWEKLCWDLKCLLF